MKVTIDGAEYPLVPLGQWTYEEAATVKRVAGLTVGQVHVGILQGDAMANFAFAVVGYSREHPDRDAADLRTKQIDQIVVDYTDEKPAEAEGRPPGRRGGRAASRSPRKS